MALAQEIAGSAAPGGSNCIPFAGESAAWSCGSTPTQMAAPEAMPHVSQRERC